jgi:hypothetical protein
MSELPPAPWRVDENSDGQVFVRDANGQIFLEVETDYPEPALTIAWAIAAFPELFVASAEALSEVDHPGAWSRLKAAIAKARGQG